MISERRILLLVLASNALVILLFLYNTFQEAIWKKLDMDTGIVGQLGSEHWGSFIKTIPFIITFIYVLYLVIRAKDKEDKPMNTLDDELD